jgi:HlyD family secretion protein
MKKGLVLALAAALLISAAAFYLVTRHKADGRDVVKVSGNIEVTTVDVSFKLPGRVKERLVDEGETVRTGQVVARLDSADFAHEADMRAAEVRTARAALRELETGSRREEIGQAEAALAAAEAEAKRLADDFQRQKALFAREVIPKQKFDAALAARDAAEAQARQARESLALVRKGPRQERIDQGRSRLTEVEAALALARERLGYTTLTAPCDGLVIAKNIEAGEQVAAGTPVVTVGDLANPWLRAYIPETELGRVKVGQKVRVTTDTWPGKAYDGVVSFISSEAEFTPKNVQTEKERVKLVYRIKVTIPNPAMELKPGMPADGEILLGTGDRGPGTGKKITK